MNSHSMASNEERKLNKGSFKSPTGAEGIPSAYLMQTSAKVEGKYYVNEWQLVS